MLGKSFFSSPTCKLYCYCFVDSKLIKFHKDYLRLLYSWLLLTLQKSRIHFFSKHFFPENLNIFEKDTLFWFKVLNSLWMGPYMIYFSMVNWIYPLKDYLGETGCYLMNVFRGAHLWEVQQQSFFISVFRFVLLFHGHVLQKFNLSPNVSAEALYYNSLNLSFCLEQIIRFHWLL